MPAADAEHEAAAAAAAAAADNELLLAELASFSEEELLACLQDREDTQAGSKQQMIERLAALIVVEAERWVSPALSHWHLLQAQVNTHAKGGARWWGSAMHHPPRAPEQGRATMITPFRPGAVPGLPPWVSAPMHSQALWHGCTSSGQRPADAPLLRCNRRACSRCVGTVATCCAEC